MQKKPQQIAEQIIALVSELANMADSSFSIGKSGFNFQPKSKDMSGATGGLRVLLNEKYFDAPRLLPEIIERLKQEGRHYSNAAISMALLNLVKERLLTRFRDKGVKKWNYVVRK